MDNLSQENRKKAMHSVKSAGTTLERKIWSMLAGMGFRGWTKNDDKISGTPDIVFNNWEKAIFIHGCFWHGCKECNRPLPVSNRKYWRKKIYRNIERDKDNTTLLITNGWQVLNIWEHEFINKSQYPEVREKISQFLSQQ